MEALKVLTLQDDDYRIGSVLGFRDFLYPTESIEYKIVKVVNTSGVDAVVPIHFMNDTTRIQVLSFIPSGASIKIGHRSLKVGKFPDSDDITFSEDEDDAAIAVYTIADIIKPDYIKAQEGKTKLIPRAFIPVEPADINGLILYEWYTMPFKVYPNGVSNLLRFRPTDDSNEAQITLLSLNPSNINHVTNVFTQGTTPIYYPIGETEVEYTGVRENVLVDGTNDGFVFGQQTKEGTMYTFKIEENSPVNKPWGINIYGDITKQTGNTYQELALLSII